MTITIIPGDNRASLRRLIDDGVRVHSVVTDPPYGLVSVQKRFGAEGATPARVEGNDGSFARLTGGFMGKCYHPDTEILTLDGWRRIAEIEAGEHVATLNPQTRDLVWQQVVQLHAYDFEGDLVRIAHRSAEQVVTPNHEVVLSVDGNRSLAVAEAGGLPKTFHLTAQATPLSGRTDRVTVVSSREYGRERELVVERESFDAAAFFRFFGLWLGDGYTVGRIDDHPANDFFGFSVTKTRKVKVIRAALQDLGIRFTETPAPTGGKTAFYCYNFALLSFLKTLGGAKEKRIPSWMFEWDASVLEELYGGLIETDGCRQGKEQEVFYTSSRSLADDFQRLCLQTGRSSTACFKPGGYTVVIGGVTSQASDAWALSVLRPGKRLYAEAGTGRASDVVEAFPYTGKVYCVGVERFHTLYTRFNGKPVWSGNSWDATGIERDPEFWRLIWEILLPGGYVFAFSGSRTGHWQACAMEQAGFIMHPMHGWVYGSGMPKAHNPVKGIDATLTMGSARTTDIRQMEMGENYVPSGRGRIDYDNGNGSKMNGVVGPYTPKTPEAQAWDGWRHGTQAQKPALEPIYLGQKPFSEKTGAANLLKHGVGAVNIDGCRVPGEAWSRPASNAVGGVYGDYANDSDRQNDKGRHPANLILDGSPEVVALFPESKGQLAAVGPQHGSRETVHAYGNYGPRPDAPPRNDSGSAARFFHQFPPDTDPIIYQGKAGKADRAGSKHPTVKPVALMQYLIRHITPPGGTVLDPFAGSGTTGEAALREGFDCLLMEAEPEYVEFLRQRFSGDLFAHVAEAAE